MHSLIEMYRKTKIITIRIPIDLLKRMSRYREEEGVSVTFQLCKGAEIYLDEKENKKRGGI